MARKRNGWEIDESSSSSDSRKSTRQPKKIKNEEDKLVSNYVLEADVKELEEDGLVSDALFEDELAELEEEEISEPLAEKSVTPKRRTMVEVKSDDDGPESRFIGDAVPDHEARKRWPDRYKITQNGSSKGMTTNDGDDLLLARCHYTQAEIDGNVIINLNDDAYVQGVAGEPNYICKVVEMFEATDGSLYFTAQWFYRAIDTAIKSQSHLIDDKRVFLSEVKDDNALGCLLEKLNIVKVPLNLNLEAHKASIPECDFYYDMMYLLPCSTYIKVPQDYVAAASSETLSKVSSEVHIEVESNGERATDDTFKISKNSEMRVLDLYSGCGAMSTGLCLGANIYDVNLVTRWAVDFNKHACESLKLNHPETEVRNESAESFFSLLKEWRKLCVIFSLIDGEVSDDYFDPVDDEGEDEDEKNPTDDGDDGEDFEVDKILGISVGNPEDMKNKGTEKADSKYPGLYFKVSWKGYESSEDTWEPREGLRHCRERVQEFVVNGHRSKILPLPGDVDVICGGPPCQGVSGFNRFRNSKNPLEDPKNKQLTVYMNIVDYLKPKFVLMENVVDLLRFSDGFLGRHALGRLVQMNYQTRMGMMAAGCYGLPQYRNRVFVWGALPSETLPAYPLPTHKVIHRGGAPNEFDENVVRHSETDNDQLEPRLLLSDAISDLPAITNYEDRDEMPYGTDPQTEFQRFIRLGKDELHGIPSRQVVFDHLPYKLNVDDHERVLQIPRRKGACFRDLPGVLVSKDNKVSFDPNMERKLIHSGKPLVPDYAMTFVRGTSSKPFARLWYDETVPTVVTRPQPHNQKILHPEQDRVLSVRENARLQGFPDYYRLSGPVKERYIQVGNAVAVPVARALGYSLGRAIRGKCVIEPMFSLPPEFPFHSSEFTSFLL